MVRLSDIVGIKDKSLGGQNSTDGKPEEEKLWLSDSQAMKVKGERFSGNVTQAESPNLEVVTYYEKFLERAVGERVKKDQGISPSPILSDLHYIIEKMLIDKMYDYAMSAHDDYDEMMLHTVHVTFASLRVGKGMDYDTKKLLELGLAAFLENVGMYKIPDNILKKERKLEEFEHAAIKNHPEVSSQILSRMGDRYRWLGEVALQVHERADGSGYPRGLKGDEISELASIIGLVDTYVAMIKKRCYREKFIQTDAIKLIIKEARDLFPPKLLKIFLNQISIFPVGTLVRLNNRSVGRVISTDKNQPLRPTVELTYDSEGNLSGKGEIIRLSENPLLYVVGSVDEKEIS